VDAALGTAVTMTERFRITGATAFFGGQLNVGITTPPAFTHQPKLFVRGDTNTSPRPQIYMSGTDGNFLLMNASGQGGDYNSINAWNRGSYLVFGTDSGAGAGHTFAIAPWATSTCGLLMSYNGTDVKVGVNTTSPTVTLDVNGDIKATNITASGTVTVGNFGGSTNVMAKATNTAGVGQVVPLFASISAYTTIALPAGTWMCSFTFRMNSGAEEDTFGSHCGVWTVPTGKYLRFFSDAHNPGYATTATGLYATSPNTTVPSPLTGVVPAIGNITSGVAWVLHSNLTTPVSAGGWAPLIPTISTVINPLPTTVAVPNIDVNTTVSHTHTSTREAGFRVGWIEGYAIRIA
jgi:hypothetical protein